MRENFPDNIKELFVYAILSTQKLDEIRYNVRKFKK